MLTLPTRPQAATPPADPAALIQLLTDLYRQQFAQMPDSAYLRTHCHPKAIRNHVHNFLWYARYLPKHGRVLDWGCNHAPDSCLLRARFGEAFDLHGCDFRPADSFPPFFDYAGLQFKQLKGNVTLPYADQTFNVVIGSGTLEHTAMDYESLKELYRVLKPGGILVVTYLPNQWSLQEWVRRTFGWPAHKRLYGLGEAKQLFKRTGFYPLVAEHQMWDSLLGPLGFPGLPSKALRWGLPIHLFSSTLRLIAKKMRTM